MQAMTQGHSHAKAILYLPGMFHESFSVFSNIAQLYVFECTQRKQHFSLEPEKVALHMSQLSNIHYHMPGEILFPAHMMHLTSHKHIAKSLKSVCS